MKKYSQKDFDDFVNKEDNIDLKLYIKPFLNRSNLVLKVILSFLFLGLFIAFFSSKEYESSIVFIPQTTSSSSSNGLSGLAMMAGLNLGSLSADNVINEVHFPMILNSNSFKKELLKEKMFVESENKFVNFEQFYAEIYEESVIEIFEKYTLGLPKLVNDLKNNLIVYIKNRSKRNDPELKTIIDSYDRPNKLSKKEKKIYNKLSSHISLETDPETGVTIIKSMLHDPDLSTQLVNKAYHLFQKFIVDFQIKKSRVELEFLQKQFIKAEKDFIKKEIALSSFQDSNINLVTSLSSTRLKKLESEYDLSNQIYSSLLNQVETQKIKVNKDSPVFTIIEDSVVPLKYSNPKRMNIVITWLFYGLVFSFLLVYYLEFYKTLKNKLINFSNE